MDYEIKQAGKFKYVEEGTGEPLVLLHGLPTSSWLWRRCLPALADQLPGWRIIAPDLPGYGHSAPRSGAGPRHLGRWLHALLREMHAEHGLTSVIATHNSRLAALCDRVLRLEQGRLHPA